MAAARTAIDKLRLVSGDDDCKVRRIQVGICRTTHVFKGHVQLIGYRRELAPHYHAFKTSKLDFGLGMMLMNVQPSFTTCDPTATLDREGGHIVTPYVERYPGGLTEMHMPLSCGMPM